ncbi:hypothetical protein [Sediminibacter sp. Hel_I_10]|uniref:hypothetical protein n=1 Tax=Sediminibacter sp. Hel_I_10 TaxID=1392490 RepID=UPI000479E68D|nr:hypothetical protein [Sediminibacter sp. Hel_I_10]
MKNFTQIICLFLLIYGHVDAQQEKGIIGTNNWLNAWTEFKPNTKDYGEPTQILTGNISKDTKLSKRDTYLLLGSVFVTDSTTLTIEPGTVIIGDFKTNGSLTISKGCKIIANGTETDPIVFTSNRGVKKEGDWGGLFILGDAPINKYGNASSVDYGLKPSAYENISYGGNDTASNSGILRYVRIEYAGKRTRQHGYFNALTLAGVGSKTVIENVMVSFSQGNSFTILGGIVNMSKMVSYRSSSNDYKFNYGTQCNISNSLAIRSPYVSGADGSKCMYVSSYNQKEEVDFTKKGTSVTAENLTLVNVSEDLDADISVGLVKEGIFVDQDAAIDISKSVISGFKPAVVFDSATKINNENLEKLKFSEMYFNNCDGNLFTENSSNNEDLENWYGNRAFYNVYSKGSDSETFIDLKNPKKPDFRLRINKILASNDVEVED